MAGACYPYKNRSGEFNAGAVDPANFPPGFLGAGGDRMRPGRGTFIEQRAYVAGNPIGYFTLPFSTQQLPNGALSATVNPLCLGGSDPKCTVKGAPVVPTPNAYVFDPASPCKAADGYTYNPRTDDVHYDQQGNIFAALPNATYALGALPTWSYVPVVAEVPVSVPGLDCQGIKSEATLLANAGGMPKPDGKLNAWALIDVAAGVYRVGTNAASASGWGTQKVGWYNHFIVTYLDGGVVPTVTATDGSKTEMVTQTVYYSRNMVAGRAGGLGFGYDVLEAARGDANYTPVCKVMSYDPGTVGDASYLPQDADTIKAMYGSTLMPPPPVSATSTIPLYIFCFQVP